MYVFAVQSAVNVWSCAVDTVLVDVIVVEFNFHPLNVYPVFSGAGNVPYTVPYSTVFVASVFPDVAPL